MSASTFTIPVSRVQPQPSPYFEAKLKAGGLGVVSVAPFTGTVSRVAVDISTATAAQVAAALGALLIDLKTRGVIS